MQDFPRLKIDFKDLKWFYGWIIFNLLLSYK